MGEPYDFDDIELRAGDVLQVAYLGPGDPWPSDTGPEEPPLGAAPPSMDGGLQPEQDDAGVPWPAPSEDGGVQATPWGDCALPCGQCHRTTEASRDRP
jgi:hypothetical protein